MTAITIRAGKNECTAPFARFSAFLGASAVYGALATVNALPNIETVMHGGDGAAKAAVMAVVQYALAFIVAISHVASTHEKGGQIAVLVFMLVNGYFAYDASSHRHDKANTTISRRAILEDELGANRPKREALGEFEHVTEDQIAEAKRKRDTAEDDKKVCAFCRAKKGGPTNTAKAAAAQTELERLMPLRTKTEQWDKLDKAIETATKELKEQPAATDSDDSLASVSGGNAKTIKTVITLLIALSIELANKYGPYWTFRFIRNGLVGFNEPSQAEIKQAAKREEEERRLAEVEARARAEAEALAAEQERLERERVEAQAKAKAEAKREAKKERAKTCEKGDPETVKAWLLDSKRTVRSPGHILDTSVIYADYEEHCRMRGVTKVAKGKKFIGELRNLGIEVRETAPNSKRFEVVGLALRVHLRTVA